MSQLPDEAWRSVCGLGATPGNLSKVCPLQALIGVALPVVKSSKNSSVGRVWFQSKLQGLAHILVDILKKCWSWQLCGIEPSTKEASQGFDFVNTDALLNYLRPISKVPKWILLSLRLHWRRELNVPRWHMTVAILFSFLQQMLIKYLFCQFLLGTDSTKLKGMIFLFSFFLEEVYLLIGSSDKKTIVFVKFNNREPGWS